MKTCSKCKFDKELSEFHKNRTRKDGHDYECRTCANAKYRAWYADNYDPERNRSHRLRRNYGVTDEWYETMKAEGCGICGTHKPGGRHGTFAVDHDHETDEVRGLLCSSCNLALGKLGDNVEGLRRALAYLEAV